MASSVSFNIRNIEARIVTAVKDAVETCALDLQGKAQLLAPIDTGDLRGSASTTPTRIENDVVVCWVGFLEEYALKQHESVGYNHPQGGQAKYLEEPTKRNETKYQNYIKRKAREAVS